ncbi:gastrula zinc finger protein XlCGF52.1-like [Bradysia coprophila]|uniref:gastrula zinc finger protein XlCGF52.1-like n=1 Tax=Bradysia coprophila TaxID=38358 RepID=UPI00187DA9CD|nr:gastrula zinc finger protein XlCGF52.1-like [Bradysia coprophila]
MFRGGFIIKNEPINEDNSDFLQNVVVKCEKNYVPHPTDHRSVKTTICSESEYVVDGNVPFESIIVKEEPRLNDCLHLRSLAASTVGESSWECYLCRHVSIDMVYLHRHLKAHSKPTVQTFEPKLSTKRNLDSLKVTQLGRRFACKKCDKTFISSSTLYHQKLAHIENNITEKLFVCDYCHRKYSRKSTLKQHLLIHSGVRKFECNECGRKFTDSSTLYKHKQTHSNDRPFACHLCHQRCSRKSTLERHLKTHSSEKSFTCNICDKKFSRNSTLNHHKLIHNGVNPFPCNQCDRKFKIKSTLDYHIKTHSGLLPFRCDECDRNFMTKTNLNQHKKNNKRHRAVHHELSTNGIKSVANKNKANSIISVP